MCHNWGFTTFRRQFGARWLTLTQTLILILNNRTLKEHRIGAETVCAENDRDKIDGAEKVRAKMVAQNRRDHHNWGVFFKRVLQNF